METYEVEIFFFLYSNILNNDNNIYNNEVEILLHHLIHICNIALQCVYIYTYMCTSPTHSFSYSKGRRHLTHFILPSPRKQNTN
jgi:hypothetical protein